MSTPRKRKLSSESDSTEIRFSLLDLPDDHELLINRLVEERRKGEETMRSVRFDRLALAEKERLAKLKESLEKLIDDSKFAALSKIEGL